MIIMLSRRLISALGVILRRIISARLALSALSREDSCSRTAASALIPSFRILGLSANPNSKAILSSSGVSSFKAAIGDLVATTL